MPAEQYNSGFSLIEVLLSVALMAVLGALSLPVYEQYANKNDIHLATDILVQSMRRAQSLSRAVDGDATWGVDVRSGSITVFQGADYGSRDTAFDEVFEISSSMGVTGVNEVVFDKLTGDPQMTGTTTLTSVDGDVTAVTINSKGMVDF